MKKKELEIATTTYTVAYKKGYTQCQEDMADKRYTEEDMFKLWTKDILYCDEQEIPHEKKLFKDFINSLNKQD